LTGNRGWGQQSEAEKQGWTHGGIWGWELGIGNWEKGKGTMAPIAFGIGGGQT
jgi:hypothetical protein